MKEFREIRPGEIGGNVFDMIGNKWMLISAGDKDGFNGMTASWGGLGVLWSLPAAFCFVRRSRYTYGFMEKCSHYSLCFFDEKYRDALKLCGTRSGRDLDKIRAAGLTPMFDEQAPYYYEAGLVLLCRKLYSDDIRAERFADAGIVGRCYSDNDYHRAYVGEVEKVLEAR